MRLREKKEIRLQGRRVEQYAPTANAALGA